MELDYIKQKALIRILDDDEALGAALKLYLELDGWQVAAYTSARRFFAEDRPSVPGCLVLDVRMPELTGLECQRPTQRAAIKYPDCVYFRTRRH